MKNFLTVSLVALFFSVGVMAQDKKDTSRPISFREATGLGWSIKSNTPHEVTVNVGEKIYSFISDPLTLAGYKGFKIEFEEEIPSDIQLFIRGLDDGKNSLGETFSDFKKGEKVFEYKFSDFSKLNGAVTLQRLALRLKKEAKPATVKLKSFYLIKDDGTTEATTLAIGPTDDWTRVLGYSANIVYTGNNNRNLTFESFDIEELNKLNVMEVELNEPLVKEDINILVKFEGGSKKGYPVSSGKVKGFSDGSTSFSLKLSSYPEIESIVFGGKQKGNTLNIKSITLKK